MLYGIKNLKTLKELDKTLIIAIGFFSKAATEVEDVRMNLKTKVAREKTLRIIKIASKQKEKLEEMRNEIFDAIRSISRSEKKF